VTRLSRIRSGRTGERQVGFPELLAQLNAAVGIGPLVAPSVDTSWGRQTAEPIGNSYTAYADQIYKANGIVFACIGVRLRLFSEIRFQYQRYENGKLGALWGDQSLAILENPWLNATTGDLTARMEQHASLAGNSYTLRMGGQLKQLRPDWVTIIVGSRNPDPNVTPDPNDIDSELLGYIYQPGGYGSKAKPVTLLPGDVAHYAPVPDPTAMYRGMSWLTPVLTEITADGMATKHKTKFFEHGGTPNIIVKYPKEITAPQLQEYLELIKADHEGVDNAYKTLHLGGGADPMVVGKDLQQLDFKVTQGAGETRIAAASGIAPIIAGFSEGLDAATYSNYGQARRHVGDLWARPSWRSAAGALATIVRPPSGSRLWYDASDVSFLQEDQKDAADILYRDASTVRTLIDAGFEPDAVKDAVTAGDLSQLTHSGLYSVQLQKPGSTEPSPAA